jgi:hypothetical protein
MKNTTEEKNKVLPAGWVILAMFIGWGIFFWTMVLKG